MYRIAHRLLLISAVLWTAALLSFTSQAAYAEVSGNCEATFKGVDVRDRNSGEAGDAIDVDENEVAPVVFTSPAGFQSHRIRLEYAGFKATVSDEVDDGETSFSDSVNIDDFDFWGAGLYKVVGEATLSDGSICSGAVLVNVTKSPLTTVAGVAAIGAAAVGGAGVIASAAAPTVQAGRSKKKVDDWVVDEIEKVGREQARSGEGAARDGLSDEMREVKAWADVWDLFFVPFFGPCWFLVLPALLLTGAAMAAPGGQAPAGEFRLRRVPWRPRLSLVGLAGGLLLGVGVAVLLQQFAVAPMTRGLAIQGLAGGIVIGFLLPNLMHTLGVLRVNSSIMGAERRLAAAMAAGRGAGGATHPAPEPPSSGGSQE